MPEEVVDRTRYSVVKHNSLSADYPLVFGGVDGAAIPRQACLMHGCVSCDWRVIGLCPHGFRKGSGHAEDKNCHAEGICKERVNYLASFNRKKVYHNFVEWQLDFNKGLASVQMRDDFIRLKESESKLSVLQGEISKLEGDGKKEMVKELNRAVQDRALARQEWFQLWKELTHFEDNAVTRESPKKVEVEHTHITISDIHRILRNENIVDVEVVKEEEEEIKGVVESDAGN